MPIITRMSRLLQADIHAVLDRLEEPEALLRQAIREMEQSLSAAQQQLQAIVNEHQTVREQRDRLQQQLQDMELQLDLCFAHAKETMARDCIKRKLQLQRMLEIFSQRIAGLEGARATVQQNINQDQLRLAEMRHKCELFERVDPTSSCCQAVYNGSDGSVSEHEVELEFLREQQSRSAK